MAGRHKEGDVFTGSESGRDPPAPTMLDDLAGPTLVRRGIAGQYNDAEMQDDEDHDCDDGRRSCTDQAAGDEYEDEDPGGQPALPGHGCLSPAQVGSVSGRTRVWQLAVCAPWGCLRSDKNTGHATGPREDVYEVLANYLQGGL